MLPDGVLNAPFRGAASLSVYARRALMKKPSPLAFTHFSPARRRAQEDAELPFRPVGENEGVAVVDRVTGAKGAGRTGLPHQVAVVAAVRRLRPDLRANLAAQVLRGEAVVLVCAVDVPGRQPEGVGAALCGGGRAAEEDEEKRENGRACHGRMLFRRR